MTIKELKQKAETFRYFYDKRRQLDKEADALSDRLAGEFALDFKEIEEDDLVYLIIELGFLDFKEQIVRWTEDKGTKVIHRDVKKEKEKAELNLN